MSTNKKFRIQNGADIHGGGLSIDDVIVIGADGKVVAGAIQEAVAELTAADIADLQAQVTAILGTSPETLDTLQEIVTAFQDADTNLVASVASNSSDIATINATLTSGVATPADVAALDTFVKGTTSELVGDSWSVESNWTLLEAAHYVGTQWGNQYDGYFGIERKGAWEQGGHNESTYVGEHSHTEGEFAEFVQTVTPGEEITIDLTVLNTGFGTTYIRLEDDGQTVTEFAPIIQTYVTTDQGDGNNVGQLVHSHTFTPTSSSIKIVVGDVPSHLQESNVSSSGARIYLKGVSITTAAPSLGTDASTVVGAVNEVHTEVDALTVAVATAKSEAISTASADATAKADAAEADAKAYADQVVAATVDAAPAALDTLNELAAALGDDANFASTVTASIATKASQVDHDAEVARATAAEGVNASAIAATNARTSGISTSSGSTDIQMTAEVDMDSNKVTNMADPTAAQDAATKAYVDAASTSSSSDLSAETAARIAADTNLQSQITALSGSTDGKDSDLQDAINAEESARIAADAVLQNNIDAEAAVRASADLALTGDISDEADARIAGDNAITAALNTEIGDRQSGDNALQTQIDFITSNTDPAALDSLTEIVAAFQSADDSITGVVTSNTTRISALEGSVTGIEAWNTDNVSEGTTNLYFTDARAKACLTGGLCITYNTTTGEISVDETEAESSLRVAESVASDDADKLDGQEGTYYRINVYNVAGTLVN